MASRSDAQLDLFVTYLTDLPLRDQRDVMERPFFNLAKRKRVEPIEYRTGDVWVRVSAPAHVGMATIYDADVLIWAVSQINQARERGQEHSARLHFQPYDLLKAIHRGVSGKEYRDLKSALRRLVATTVETNIRSGDGQRSAIFHWLERVEEQTDAEGNSKGIVIELPRWLYEGITAHQVLAVHPSYFQLTSGLARWLYRVVRKHAGNQASGWSFTFSQLHQKSGSTQRLSDFARDLRRLVKADQLPEYHVEIFRGDRGDECLYAVRRTLLADGHPAKDTELLQERGKRRTRPRLK